MEWRQAGRTQEGDRKAAAGLGEAGLEGEALAGACLVIVCVPLLRIKLASQAVPGIQRPILGLGWKPSFRSAFTALSGRQELIQA